MRFKNTLRLLAGVMIMAGVLWVAERRWTSTEARARQSEHLTFLPMDEVTYLLIERGELRMTCEKRGDGWAIVSPIRARAAAGAVERVLAVLEVLPRRETVTGIQRRDRALTLSDYGLAEPRGRVVLCGATGREDLHIGDDSPLGNFVYVKSAGHDDVVGTSRDILEVLPDSIETWRDRRLIPGDIARTTRVDIQRPGAGFIQLVRRDGGWWIDQPVAARAEAGCVTDLLDAVYAARAETFVWDPPVDASGDSADSSGLEGGPTGRLAPYGLVAEAASARVSVWLNGDSIGQEIILGKPAGEDGAFVYAKRRQWDSIVTVDARILDALAVTVAELRARDVFRLSARDVRTVRLETGDRKITLSRESGSGWHLTEPVRAKADDPTVEALVGDLVDLRVVAFRDAGETNAAALGLDEPALRVLMSAAASVGDNAAGTAVSAPVLVIARLPKDKDVVAALEGTWPAFTLDRVAAQSLVDASAEPLAFRDRTLLAVPSRDVVRLVLTRDGVTQSVVRGADGAWGSAPGSTGRVDQAAVEAVLFAVANLRAVSLKDQDMGQKAAYGLEPPGVTLTLGLAGEAGIRKTIQLGYRARTEGLYAMIQGQDVVFVLDRATTEMLSLDLLVTESHEETSPSDQTTAD